MTPAELPGHWRAAADLLALHGAEEAARTCRLHAAELEACLRSQADEALDLAQAAAVSGYSPDRLRHMVSDGTIPNAGQKGRPRIRRCDLPVKRPSRNGFDAAAQAAAILRPT